MSVLRSSQLILHDLATGARRRAIDLGDRGGYPRLALRGHLLRGALRRRWFGL